MANIPLQAAVITMLLAKRPALAALPITWELHGDDGSVWASLALNAPSSQVPLIAAELGLALRGASCDARDGTMPSGRKFRCHTVYGKHAGVAVNLTDYEYPDEALKPTDGGGR